MTQMSGGRNSRNYDDGDGTEIIDFQRQFSQSQTVITTRSSNYLLVFYSLFPPRLHVTLVGFGGLGLEFQMLVPISSINRTCNEMKRCWMLFLGCFCREISTFAFQEGKTLAYKSLPDWPARKLITKPEKRARPFQNDPQFLLWSFS